MEDKEPQNIDSAQICAWCDGPAELLSHYESGNVICISCYRLLIRAGISDKEIFTKVIQKDKLITIVNVKHPK